MKIAMILLNPVLVLAASLLAPLLNAHHSIPGAYDTRREIRVEGKVVAFEFVNPHPYVRVSVAEDDGEFREWRLEMDNRGELLRAGISQETLNRDDRIIVTGSPSRTQSRQLYIQRLDRPNDGFAYEQVGSSPRIRTAPR